MAVGSKDGAWGDEALRGAASSLNQNLRCYAALCCSYGKTTTAWLARGMFEETNELCGMTGAPA